MNAPLQHPVVPAAVERQEIAPTTASVAIPVTYDLDALDQNKFQGVAQRSALSAWRR
jgi:hypothetical protein